MVGCWMFQSDWSWASIRFWGVLRTASVSLSGSLGVPLTVCHIYQAEILQIPLCDLVDGVSLATEKVPGFGSPLSFLALGGCSTFILS